VFITLVPDIDRYTALGKRQQQSQDITMSPQNGLFKFLLLLGALAITSQAMTRYIGDPDDGRTQNISQHCGGFDQMNFATGRCPALMSCVLDDLPSDTAAGFQSGGAIAALLPTTLALIAAPPLETVKYALLSPHRAIATACFGIGLPSGLFRQLQARSTSRTREWKFSFPPKRTTTGWRNPRDAGMTLIADALVIGLTAVAIWFNYRVSSRVMITWRCEYGWLVFMW
jgi:hypothetical protein